MHPVCLRQTRGFVPGRWVSWWSPPHVPHLSSCLVQSSGGFVGGPTRDICHWCCNPCPSLIRVPSHCLGTGLRAGRSGSFVVPLNTQPGGPAVDFMEDSYKIDHSTSSSWCSCIPKLARPSKSSEVLIALVTATYKEQKVKDNQVTLLLSSPVNFVYLMLIFQRAFPLIRNTVGNIGLLSHPQLTQSTPFLLPKQGDYSTQRTPVDV